MKRAYPVWILLAALAIFGPVAWRVFSWQRARPQAVETDMVKVGDMLFSHDWQPNDTLANGGDGIGPVFNAKSCAACHHQNGPGGSGDLDHNVTTFLVLASNGQPQRQGVVHAFATDAKYQETLQNIDRTMPPISQPSLTQILPTSRRVVGRGGVVLPGEVALSIPSSVRLSQRNTPALFGAGLIDSIPDQVIIANERRQRLNHAMASADTNSLPVGRAHRLADGKIGRFGWKAQMASLSEFVQAACANELGLGNPGSAQPESMSRVAAENTALDLTQLQCDQLTAFVAALPRPVEKIEAHEQAQVAGGKALFSKLGCAECHTPNLGPVQGIYSDLLLHRMGQELEGGSVYYGAPVITTDSNSQSSGPRPDEWRTPPLWGVGDSGPYMHDGRAATLAEAIQVHGGQAAASANRFERLTGGEQAQVLAFMRSLRAPK